MLKKRLKSKRWTEDSPPCTNHNWAQTPSRLSTRDCIRIATLQGTWKQFTFPPDLFFFFWFHGLRNSERGWLFQRDGKKEKEKRLLEVLYKGRLMPFKWTITNGVDMLLSKMNEVSLERQSSSNKSLPSEPRCNTRRQLGLPSSSIIKDTLGALIILQAHFEQTHTRT